MKKYTVPFVDDEEQNLLLFRHAFFRYYQILTANPGREALEILSEHPVHVLVTDQPMPRMTAIQLLTQVRKRHPSAMRMIVTGYSDVEAVMQAFKAMEIFQYVLKPWNNENFRQVMDNAPDTF
jgi:response regulator RpfG family c-di-GMP phosphodiesterase